MIKVDEKTKAKYWLTADRDWLDKLDMPINEPLSVSLKLFKPGTTIEINGQLEDLPMSAH